MKIFTTNTFETINHLDYFLSFFVFKDLFISIWKAKREGETEKDIPPTELSPKWLKQLQLGWSDARCQEHGYRSPTWLQAIRTWPPTTAFPGHWQRARLTVKQPQLKPAPKRTLGTMRTGLACYKAPAPIFSRLIVK